MTTCIKEINNKTMLTTELQKNKHTIKHQLTKEHWRYTEVKIKVKVWTFAIAPLT